MEGIRKSQLFLALGTKDYANSIKNPNEDDHHLIISQIGYAKSVGKPAAILIGSNLSDEDEKTIRDALDGMEIIGVFKFEEGNEASMESAVMKMRNVIDSPTFRG